MDVSLTCWCRSCNISDSRRPPAIIWWNHLVISRVKPTGFIDPMLQIQQRILKLRRAESYSNWILYFQKSGQSTFRGEFWSFLRWKRGQGTQMRLMPKSCNWNFFLLRFIFFLYGSCTTVAHFLPLRERIVLFKLWICRGRDRYSLEIKETWKRERERERELLMRERRRERRKLWQGRRERAVSLSLSLSPSPIGRAEASERPPNQWRQI